MTTTKNVGQFIFQSGSKKFYLNSPRAMVKKKINAQTTYNRIHTDMNTM